MEKTVSSYAQMTAFDTECLEAFSRWLGGMPAEVGALCDVLERPAELASEMPDACRVASAESLAHLVRSLDLIPDGVEALGYLENLFAFRAIMRGAVGTSPEAAGADPTFARLASEADLVASFLGDDFARLLEASARAQERTRPGQSSRDLLDDAELRSAALMQVRAWAATYSAPELALTEAELIKLRSFMRVRLGRA